MDLKQHEYMVAIADMKSLSRAAERFYVSQSALSQQLSKLQKQGLPPLFEYKEGKMLPTDAGKIYLNGARTVMSLKAQCERELAALPKQPDNDP